MGRTRYKKFLDKCWDVPLGGQEEWDKIVQFLEFELKKLKRRVAAEQSMQPLCMGNNKPEMPNKGDKKKSNKNLGSRDGYTAAGGNDDPVCVI